MKREPSDSAHIAVLLAEYFKHWDSVRTEAQI